MFAQFTTETVAAAAAAMAAGSNITPCKRKFDECDGDDRVDMSVASFCDRAKKSRQREATTSSSKNPLAEHFVLAAPTANSISGSSSDSSSSSGDSSSSSAASSEVACQIRNDGSTARTAILSSVLANSTAALSSSASTSSIAAPAAAATDAQHARLTAAAAAVGNGSSGNSTEEEPQPAVSAADLQVALALSATVSSARSIVRDSMASARSATAAARKTSPANEMKITPANLNEVKPATSLANASATNVTVTDIVDRGKRARRCERGFGSKLGAASSAASSTTASTTMPPAEVLGDIDQVDGVFRRAAVWAMVSWVVLLSATLAFYYNTVRHERQSDGSYVDGSGYLGEDYDDGLERGVPQTAFFVLLASTVMQLTPILLSKLRSGSRSSTGTGTGTGSTNTSGILVAALVIQCISLLTNALLGWGPRVVVMDPVTGSRVFLIRWCEWIPLSGFMTLLAESADIAASPNAWKAPMIFALCQSISTLCGIVLPFCQTTSQWAVVMFISCITFVMIFPRVYRRYQAFQKTPKGRTVLEQEYYDRRKFAYYLILMCSICWSTLVTLYTANLTIHMTLPASHWLRFPSLAMSCDTIADVLAKAVYMKVIVEAHQAVFACDLRTARQLNELKQLMSMLWVSSSDVIVISSKQNNHRKATMLSPSFLTLVGANPPMNILRVEDYAEEGEDERLSVALVLETDRGKVISAYYVDTRTMSDGLHPESIDGRIMLGPEDLNHNAVQQALRITNATWTATNSDKEDEPLRALSIVPCDQARRQDGGKVMCEMKISRHTQETAVAVVRDVTERYRRFEAESRVHAEIIARQRDMHTANRFTRHEVKNGLLASIELCHTLGQSLSDLREMLKKGTATGNVAAAHDSIQNLLQDSSALLDDRTMKSLLDLDGELHGVLDTVLAEVMAREVVHGVYQPRLEELDVPAMLLSGLGMSKDRIPLTVKGGSMPKLLLDAQLIGHIHRNAVSNACKYGKQGGPVKSMVEFDSANQEFRLEVINEPGVGHETLLAMGETASEFVFAQGVRLQPHMKGKTEKKLDSSGDGAWIMQKCAMTMKGACSIEFTTEGTHFTFHCPAVPVARNNKPTNVNFVVPENVRAIGIDDSKIQRKLLARILTHVGVDPSKQLLLGESPGDVTELESTLMNLMDEHQSDKFLLIVDEHLDYDNLASKQQDGVYSGSLVMKQILEHMPQDRLSRCLVLMRSANDSAVDIAMYTERTHGYFPKAIMQKDRTREILAPLWLKHFPGDAV